MEAGLVLRPTSFISAPPRHNLLPQLVQVLDKINGKPLSGGELEALIKSFPMGESIWRMGAYELWRAGFTGQGVQVAVIDTGVGHHPELEGAVASRQNFTHQRGGGILGNHATAVAGTIHALAPGATVYSYRALDERAFQENARLHLTQEEVQRALLKAVDKAVADGNRIVNMSLGGVGCPCGELAQSIDKYAKQGVIFVISAGNEKDAGVRSPSNASLAMTVGALDVNNRLAAFSSYGENFDPTRVNYGIKTVFMTPGQRLPVLMHNSQGSYMYGKMSGTSIAAPHMSGTMALLLPAVQQLNRTANPFQLSRKLQETLVSTAKAIPRNELPSNVPPEQDFLIVDPVAAYRALRPSA
jgi:subtilisin family serine protease